MTKHRTVINRKPTPLYYAWRAMLSRCYYENSQSYPRYGGRGIKVCDRWRDSFQAFAEDMGPHPGNGFSLDREKNDEDYSKDNCRWANWIQQNNNRSNNRHLTHDGITLTVAGWATKLGISYFTLHTRLRRMSVERALTIKHQKKGKPNY